jgi:hypothetical protein
MRSIHKYFASLVMLAFLSCAGGLEVTSPSDDVNSQLNALISLQGSLGSLAQSSYATCSNSGDLTNPLIQKICTIAQSADAELQTMLLDQIGIFSNALQTQITQMESDLVSNTQAVSSRIDTINATIATLTTQMTSAASAITALQSAVSSITRNNFVLVKSLSNFPTPVAGVITLLSGTDYQMNGIINLGTNTLVLSSGTQIFGLDQLNDGLKYTGAGTMISNVANANVIINNLNIQTTAAATIFGLTGNSSTQITITNNYFTDTGGATLGTITGGNDIWFYNNNSSSSTAMTGLTVAGTVTYLGFMSNVSYNTSNTSLVTMLAITSGTFTSVIIDGNNSITPAANTNPRAFNIPAVGATFTDGNLTNNNCANGLLLWGGATQVAATSSSWWFQNNTGLQNSNYYGQMYISTSTAQPTTITNFYPVRGTYASSSTERFTFQAGIIEDNRTAQSPNLAIVAGGSGYAVGNLLTVSVNGTGSQVKVKTVSSGSVTALDFTTSYLPGKNYIVATPEATTVTPAGGSGCTLNVEGVSGRLIYNGTVAMSMRVHVDAAVTSVTAAARTITLALYNGNTSTEVPAAVAGATGAVATIATANTVYPISFEYIVSMNPNDYIEVWSATSGASAYTVTSLQVTISPM